MIGQPVRTANGDLEFYLLFPLDSEQRTLGLVQSTLIVGGLVLLLLLAGIASIITRQVVRPVRRAAEIAERFADGHLDERLPVQGEDELARLGESYNEMAGSIQEQIRQLEEFGALQRRFTSDVSHELRTPLTTVRMAADVLYASRDELLPALRRSSELLVTELDRFESLLGDLLEISRLDAGVAELGAERVDMHGVVSRAVEAVRGLADELGTPLELDLPTGVWAEVDPRRVERIVRNLVANAIDHSEAKPVRVMLGADEHAVAVVVRDHGVGLRPGEASLVFNRFWRAEESRARRTGGTGLGLSIAVEDARLHGGWLQAWGEPGKGAVFRLTLPRDGGDVLESSPLPLGPERDTPRRPTGRHVGPDAAAGLGAGRRAMACLPGARDDRSCADNTVPATFSAHDRPAGRGRRSSVLGLAGCASVPDSSPVQVLRQVGGDEAAPPRRPRRRQQPARPRPRLRHRLRQQHRQARRRPRVPRPRGGEVGRHHRRHRPRRPDRHRARSGRARVVHRGDHHPHPRHPDRPPHPGRGVRARAVAVPVGRRRRPPRRPVADLPAARRRRRAAVDLPGRLPDRARLVRRPHAAARRRRRAVRAERARQGAGRPGDRRTAHRAVERAGRGRGVGAGRRAPGCGRTSRRARTGRSSSI